MPEPQTQWGFFFAATGLKKLKYLTYLYKPAFLIFSCWSQAKAATQTLSPVSKRAAKGLHSYHRPTWELDYETQLADEGQYILWYPFTDPGVPGGEYILCMLLLSYYTE